MKKIIFPIIFILLITSVLALQPIGGILFGDEDVLVQDSATIPSTIQVVDGKIVGGPEDAFYSFLGLDRQGLLNFAREDFVPQRSRPAISGEYSCDLDNKYYVRTPYDPGDSQTYGSSCNSGDYLVFYRGHQLSSSLSGYELIFGELWYKGSSSDKPNFRNYDVTSDDRYWREDYYVGYGCYECNIEPADFEKGCLTSDKTACVESSNSQCRYEYNFESDCRRELSTQGTCVSHGNGQICDGANLYWHDSCGAKQELAQTCTYGCDPGERVCNSAPPAQQPSNSPQTSTTSGFCCATPYLIFDTVYTCLPVASHCDQYGGTIITSTNPQIASCPTQCKTTTSTTTPSTPTSSVPFCDSSMLVGVTPNCKVPIGQNIIVTDITITKSDGSGVTVTNGRYDLKEETDYKIKVTVKNTGSSGTQYVEVGYYDDNAQWLQELSRAGFVNDAQSCVTTESTKTKEVNLNANEQKTIEFIIKPKSVNSDILTARVGVVAYHRCWTTVNDAYGGSEQTSAVFIPAIIRNDVTSPTIPPAQLCSNTVKDGSETDLDCGGPDCSSCTIGEGCLKDSDCTSPQICSKGVGSENTCHQQFTTGFFGIKYCINTQKDIYQSKVVDIQGSTIDAVAQVCPTGNTCTYSNGVPTCLPGTPEDSSGEPSGDTTTTQSPKVCCSGFAGRYSCVESTECEEGLFTRVVLEGTLDYKSCPTECKVTDGTTGSGGAVIEDGQVTGKQKSMLLSDWMDTTGKTRLKTICEEDDDCSPYTNEDGDKLDVTCLGTTKILTKLEQDLDELCPSILGEGIGSWIIKNIPVSGSLAIFVENKIKANCEENAGFEIGDGACIAQPKGGDFFGPIVEAINNALGTDFGVGTVVIVLGVLILLLFIFLSKPQQQRMV